MRASVFALCLILLAGCDLLGDDGTPLAFRAVPTTLEAVPDSVDRLFVLVRTAADAEALRADTGLGTDAIPEVDWTRETLFVHVLELRSTDLFFPRTVRLKRDVVEIEAVVRRGQGSGGERLRSTVAVAIADVPPGTGGLSFRSRVENPAGR